VPWNHPGVRWRGASLGPLRQRPFRLLFLGRTLSAIGDSIVPVAVTFAVLKLGTTTDLGVVLGVGSATRVVFLVAGGVWADRLPRQLVMMGSDLLRAVVQALIALAFFVGNIHVWELAAGSVVFGFAGAFFNPASTGLIPSIVPAEHLQEANALLGLSRGILEVSGPAVAGVIVVTLGFGVVFAVDSASFVASFLCLAAMRLPAAIDRIVGRSMLAEAREGLHEVLVRRWMVAGLACDLVVNFALAILFVLPAAIVKAHYGGARDWGFLLTAGAIGGLLGSAAAVRYKPRRPLLVTYLTAFVIPLQLLAYVPPLPLTVLLIGSAVLFWQISLGNAFWATMEQQHVPGEALARVDSLLWLGSLVVYPIGLAAAGPIASAIGTRTTLILAASLAAAAVTGALAVRDVRELGRVEPFEPVETAPGLPLVDQT
jgi:MFS family permease